MPRDTSPRQTNKQFDHHPSRDHDDDLLVRPEAPPKVGSTPPPAMCTYYESLIGKTRHGKPDW